MSSKGSPRSLSQRRQQGSVKAAFIHCLLVFIFGAVWAWHLTPKANEQEVAKKKGWFFEYYTFAGFTLQLAQFVIAFAADLTRKGWLIRIADDISCASVPVVIFITAFYYCLLLSGNIVDSDDVPSWVSPALHTGNFAGMLADLLVCWEERTFCSSSSLLSASMNILYVAFLYFTSAADGCYPYAFLEGMPQPHGIILTAVVLVLGVEILFLACRKAKQKAS